MIYYTITISDVVKKSENPIRIHPAVGSLLSPVRVEDFLPVLPGVGLEPEEPVSPQICLNVVLSRQVLLGENCLQATTC